MPLDKDFIDENKRYGEPKQIGDIMNDMGINTENITEKKVHAIHNKQWADPIFKNMNLHLKGEKTLEFLYKEVKEFIFTMDKYFLEEKRIFRGYKKLIANNLRSKEDIYDKIYHLDIASDAFENEKTTIYKNMRTAINIFPDKEDRNKHHKTSNEFYELFIRNTGGYRNYKIGL